MLKFIIVVLCCNLMTGKADFDLASSIFESVSNSLKNSFANMGNLFGNMGSNMGNIDNSQQPASPFNLGSQIFQSINKQLAPVRAMAAKGQMQNGVGGTTVATYYGNRPTSFVIKNGIRYVCNGKLNGPSCYGTLQPFAVTTNQDFCFAKYYANINDKICLSTGPINIFSTNPVPCTTDGTPIIVVSMAQYNNLCGNTMPWQVMYTYYANPNDPRSVQIPGETAQIICINSQPGVCEFEGDASGGGTSMYSSNGNSFMSFNN